MRVAGTMRKGLPVITLQGSGLMRAGRLWIPRSRWARRLSRHTTGPRRGRRDTTKWIATSGLAPSVARIFGSGTVKRWRHTHRLAPAVAADSNSTTRIVSASSLLSTTRTFAAAPHHDRYAQAAFTNRLRLVADNSR